MRISDEIRILDLLALRDAEYLRVRECEDKIRQILGGSDFPFPAPPVEPPSLHRKGKPFKLAGIAMPEESKKPRHGHAASVSGGDCAMKTPALDPSSGENAYRVVFEEKGAVKVSYLQHPQQLDDILKLQCDSFRITCVETVSFRSLDDFKTLRRIPLPSKRKEK